MYTIEFYENEKGKSEIKEFLDGLLKRAATNKDARIQFTQISTYIELLQQNGTRLPQQIVKHIQDEIWELRPGHNRIFFFCYLKDTFVLLHHFRKKTQKTPKREIEKAKKEMIAYSNRKDLAK